MQRKPLGAGGVVSLNPMPNDPPPDLADLRARLPELMLRDAARLQRRLDAVPRGGEETVRRARLAECAHAISAAQVRVARRGAGVPAITYPEALPVSARRTEIAAAIRGHQVVVVAGETGSGKTTQLPKICLELGRGVRGRIGHTQPRRIAARSVAERIAEELDTELGGVVGYKVRFHDEVGEDSLVKVMTDGVLLAEVGHDRRLEQYDTIIVDEAHERSLDIDFLLGYLKQLLPTRPDLKLIITSATIDPDRFARHFGGAPVIEVSGRMFPVEVRYRPLDEGDVDQVQAVCDAVEELTREVPGDVLVFLSGEREIRDTGDALTARELGGTDVLPLYGRLSAAEQHRVFEPHEGRRVVLATNVAETSLTVPGIRYVVDPGTARISRYSHRTKVQRLPIEAISQASANQRAGRCGRLADGVCVRLYAEDDLSGRPAYTDPEILRTNLAAVLLRMAALGFGDVDSFPFLDPPDRRHVRDGVALLQELGAFDTQRRITALGRRLAQLPIDPRLGRMVLAAGQTGCLREVLVIAAGLSIQDPRERPTDDQQAADTQHRRFADEHSDFLAYWNLWQYLREQQRTLSSNRFRKLVRGEFLHYLRIREWQDLHAQLRRIATDLDLPLNEAPASGDVVHQALLAGLLSHIGLRQEEKRNYVGARGARFAISPGSALFRKPPRWVVAAELVETSRLWARVVSRIEPEWAERLAGPLAKRSYSEPHWERKRGSVVASERVTLYGVPLVAARKVDYGRIDPVLSRELFLRQALVEGDWPSQHAFLRTNRRLLAEAGELEERARRRDLVVDETLFAFYDERVPADVVSGRHFDVWWKAARLTEPDLLDFSADMLLTNGIRRTDYPAAWAHGELRLPLSYVFEPGSESDGVTVAVPLAVLDRLDPADFEWQVPGLRLELVTALLRTLPKQLRVAFIPAPDVARATLAALQPRQGRLLDALATELQRRTGVGVPPDAWQPERLPPYLRMTFRVEDQRGRALAVGKDLAGLQRGLQGRLRALVAAAAVDVEQHGLHTWSFGMLPRTVQLAVDGHPVTGHPALVDEGDAVGVRVFRTAAEQGPAMWRGTRRLLLLRTPSPLRAVVGRLSNETKLALGRSPYAGVPALLEDCVAAAVDALLADRGGPAWDEEGFATLLDVVTPRLAESTHEVVTTVAAILLAAAQVETRLATLPEAVRGDLRAHLNRLVCPGFVRLSGARRLPDVLRYVRGLERRAVKLREDPARDQQRAGRMDVVQQAYADLLHRLPPDPVRRATAHGLRWQLEELRISLFAQELGTRAPVSEQRVLREIEGLGSSS